jgi:hypothetical protein
MKTYEGFIKNTINLFKLANLLKNWSSKYQTEEYDKVITQAFDIIDAFNLSNDILSTPFTLPNNQLETEFIKKFFNEAEKRGYEAISNPSETTTTFKFRRASSFQRALKKIK